MRNPESLLAFIHSIHVNREYTAVLLCTDSLLTSRITHMKKSTNDGDLLCCLIHFFIFSIRPPVVFIASHRNNKESHSLRFGGKETKV